MKKLCGILISYGELAAASERVKYAQFSNIFSVLFLIMFKDMYITLVCVESEKGSKMPNIKSSCSIPVV